MNGVDALRSYNFLALKKLETISLLVVAALLILGGSRAANAQRLWGHSVGGAAFNGVGLTSILLEPNHDVVMTSFIFSPEASYSKVVAYDSKGQWLWDRVKPLDNYEGPSTVSALDYAGNIIVVAVDFLYAGARYLQYSPSGELMTDTSFNIPIGSPQVFKLTKIVIGQDNSVYGIGNELTFASYPSYTSSGSVFKVSPKGQLVWAKTYPSLGLPRWAR